MIDRICNRIRFRTWGIRWFPTHIDPDFDRTSRNLFVRLSFLHRDTIPEYNLTFLRTHWHHRSSIPRIPPSIRSLLSSDPPTDVGIRNCRPVGPAYYSFRTRYTIQRGCTLDRRQDRRRTGRDPLRWRFRSWRHRPRAGRNRSSPRRTCTIPVRWPRTPYPQIYPIARCFWLVAAPSRGPPIHYLDRTIGRSRFPSNCRPPRWRGRVERPTARGSNGASKAWSDL